MTTPHTLHFSVPTLPFPPDVSLLTSTGDVLSCHSMFLQANCTLFQTLFQDAAPAADTNSLPSIQIAESLQMLDILLCQCALDFANK